MTEKLFAVYLGGRAPKCNTELHDVVFVTGNTIEDTYEQLMDKWFGTPAGLHLDSWVEVDVIDGYRIGFSKTKPQGPRLYFVNLGAYNANEFTEVHANIFLVADSIPEAKKRAKAELLKGFLTPVHTDDLHEVDDCIEVQGINGLFVSLEKTGEKQNLKYNNSYHIVPKGIVEDYMRRHGLLDEPNYRASFG